MEKVGILFEISPWGTGFIDDSETHRAFGFHHSMLLNFQRSEGMEWHDLLEGKRVSFVEVAGHASTVQLTRTTTT